MELRSVEEASAMIQLDGIKYLNSTLRIRRPDDYAKMPKVEPKYSVPKIDTVALGII